MTRRRALRSRGNWRGMTAHGMTLWNATNGDGGRCCVARGMAGGQTGLSRDDPIVPYARAAVWSAQGACTVHLVSA